MTVRGRAQARYEAHHRSGQRYGFSFGEASRAAQFSTWLGPRKRLLDAGCRDGTLLRHYAAAHRAVGCDLDATALRAVHDAGIAPVVHVDLLQGLPFRGSAFDAVILGEVLEHLADAGNVLADIARVLVPGGLFLGSVPNAYRLRNRLMFAMGRPFDPDPTHVHWFAPAQLRRLLERTGFERVEFVFLESRFLRLSPSLFGNTMLWKAHRRA
jgi:SAM-dependent methyltransferase